MATVVSGHGLESSVAGHARWVRISHWILAASVLTLAFSGFVILMAHPRLYWGNAGNDLTPALLELPFGRNYKHGGWLPETTFFAGAQSAVSAVRTYDIFNQNGWARSLHFLAAWFLSLTGLTYLIVGLINGHVRHHLFPRPRDFAPKVLWDDFVKHLRLPIARKRPD
jgi:Ni,Fe-hydrogenase I cytochrome b subunit